MASLTAIRTAVKTTLEARIPDLTVYRTVPDVTNVPAAVVEPNVSDFVVAMGRGTDTWTFDLHVLAPYADPELGQDSLDAYITGAGAQSIRQVIFQNKTLGLTNVDAHIAGMVSGSYNTRFEIGAIQHVGATLRLIVHTTGTE